MHAPPSAAHASLQCFFWGFIAVYPLDEHVARRDYQRFTYTSSDKTSLKPVRDSSNVVDRPVLRASPRLRRLANRLSCFSQNRLPLGVRELDACLDPRDKMRGIDPSPAHLGCEQQPQGRRAAQTRRSDLPTLTASTMSANVPTPVPTNRLPSAFGCSIVEPSAYAHNSSTTLGILSL